MKPKPPDVMGWVTIIGGVASFSFLSSFFFFVVVLKFSVTKLVFFLVFLFAGFLFVGAAWVAFEVKIGYRKKLKQWGKVQKLRRKQGDKTCAVKREQRKTRKFSQSQMLREPRTLKEKLRDVRFSDNRNNYVISNKDYKRGLHKENEYRRRHKPTLFGLYHNRCAKCSDDSNGLEIDHFVFAKNEGGCFAMKHKEGHRINNAIPLCRSCNSSKSDKPYDEFFDANELLTIFTKNVEMTKRLNDKTLGF